ncbi:MAG TPA: hypothetical protein VMT11_07085 [Myxococcaceae bacterium]|nr:hypothetical protein [Myxococcaceae bacterium]
MTAGRARRWLPHLVAVLGALQPRGARGADGAPVEEFRDRYAGEYLFVGGASERALVPAAVERSVDGMFFIARGIAYDRLLRTCEICSSYTLGFGGGNISVAGPCQLTDVSPDDGREVDHRTKLGDTSKLSQRFERETLVQTFRAEEGSRKVVWMLLPGGATLRVQVIITSKHLPHPVDYALTYQRKSAPRPAPPAAGASDAGPSPRGAGGPEPVDQVVATPRSR